MRSRIEYIRKRKVPEKRDSETSIRKKRRVKRRTLREESEQCIFLCISSLLGQSCIRIFAHLIYDF